MTETKFYFFLIHKVTLYGNCFLHAKIKLTFYHKINYILQMYINMSIVPSKLILSKCQSGITGKSLIFQISRKAQCQD